MIFHKIVVTMNGEKHYNPPEEHKDRLARRWIYIRATYAFANVLASPSIAQVKHADAIFKLVSETQPSAEELALHNELSNRYGGWRNPLMFPGDERDGFLQSKGFQMLVFEGPD